MTAPFPPACPRRSQYSMCQSWLRLLSSPLDPGLLWCNGGGAAHSTSARDRRDASPTNPSRPTVTHGRRPPRPCFVSGPARQRRNHADIGRINSFLPAVFAPGPRESPPWFLHVFAGVPSCLAVVWRGVCDVAQVVMVPRVGRTPPDSSPITDRRETATRARPHPTSSHPRPRRQVETELCRPGDPATRPPTQLQGRRRLTPAAGRAGGTRHRSRPASPVSAGRRAGVAPPLTRRVLTPQPPGRPAHRLPHARFTELVGPPRPARW